MVWSIEVEEFYLLLKKVCLKLVNYIAMWRNIRKSRGGKFTCQHSQRVIRSALVEEGSRRQEDVINTLKTQNMHSTARCRKVGWTRSSSSMFPRFQFSKDLKKVQKKENAATSLAMWRNIRESRRGKLICQHSQRTILTALVEEGK